MLILGIDTAGQGGSVALVRAVEDRFETIGRETLEGGSYSERLLPAIAELLEKHGLPGSAIELIGVASGPGSFTGLRVAMATSKGLAEAFAMPVIGVSVLEAVALQAEISGAAIAALDAQRGEIFIGEYLIDSTAVEPALMKREAVVKLAKCVECIGANEEQVPIVTPDGKLCTRLAEAGVSARLVRLPVAEDFASIACRKWRNGAQGDWATLDANYVRRSDAEIFSAPKPVTNSGKAAMES